MLIGIDSKFVGIFISTGRLREEVNVLAFKQKLAFYNVITQLRKGASLNQTILQYQTSLRQISVDLHSLGYPMISFYVDNALSNKISNHQHTSLVDTMHKLAYISNRLKHSCLQYTPVHELPRRPRISACGSVHMHNLHDMHSMQGRSQYFYTISIMVPHMFYIQIQFLEIILVGGFLPDECYGFQSFTMWRNTIFPFGSLYARNIWEHRFCGTHHPFKTIFPSNLVVIKGHLRIDNSYASIDLRYSMIEMMVSNC